MVWASFLGNFFTNSSGHTSKQCDYLGLIESTASRAFLINIWLGWFVVQDGAVVTQIINSLVELPRAGYLITGRT
jgi:hypothetical protein